MIDIERLLHRVVRDVFGETTDVTYRRESRHWHHATLAADHGTQRRSARLRAGYYVFLFEVPGLGVSTFRVEEDEDEGAKMAALREVAFVARAYLNGEGHVEQRRGLIRTRPVLKLTVDGCDWELRRPLWSRGTRRPPA